MKYIFYVLLFLAGFVTASFFEEEMDVEEFETTSGNYQFISPLRACDSSPTNIKNKKVAPIKQAVESLIEENSNKTETVSVYYRDLLNGPWFGINEDQIYTSASLGKIPVMMTIYKMAETNPNILKSTISNNGQFDEFQNLNEDFTISKGVSIELEEIIYYMIAYSDNIALEELKTFIKALQLDAYKNVYVDIGLGKDFGEETYNITAKEMGSIIRILYNATYLNERYSEKALKIMSESTFDAGIKKYIPENVKVANKFGIKYKETGIHHHDCGIVYFPSNPYMLCVMTRGNSEQNQAELIALISKTIYDHLSGTIIYK